MNWSSTRFWHTRRFYSITCVTRFHSKTSDMVGQFAQRNAICVHQEETNNDPMSLLLLGKYMNSYHHSWLLYLLRQLKWTNCYEFPNGFFLFDCWLFNPVPDILPFAIAWPVEQNLTQPGPFKTKACTWEILVCMVTSDVVSCRISV